MTAFTATQITLEPPRCDEHHCSAAECAGREHTGEVSERCDICGAAMRGMVCTCNGYTHTMVGCPVCDGQEEPS